LCGGVPPPPRPERSTGLFNAVRFVTSWFNSRFSMCFERSTNEDETGAGEQANDADDDE